VRFPNVENHEVVAGVQPALQLFDGTPLWGARSCATGTLRHNVKYFVDPIG